MRIAFLTSVFSYGGAQMSSIELAVRLRPVHEVKFFDTYGCSNPFIKALQDNNIDLSVLSPSTTPYIVSKHSNKLLNLFRYLIFFFKWYRIRQNVHNKLKHYEPDIVIVYDDRCLSYLIAYKNKQFKTLFYARSWYIPAQIPITTKYLLKRFVDGLICISEATRHALYCSNISSLDKLYVVHNSINEEKINSVKEIELKSCFKIIHSGAYIPSKGQHIALKTAKLLKENKIDFHIYLCGLIYPGFGDQSSKYYDDLVNYVKCNQLENFVSFVVGESNIISYIKACDIMFFPSSSEGLPRSILEAMALGKPVIANAVGGVTDLVFDRYTGFLTRYNNPVNYADYTELLINNPLVYKQIANNALSLIRTSFNEKIQIDKMNEIFNSLHLNK